MAGPWEKFQPASESAPVDGPWSKFQAAQPQGDPRATNQAPAQEASPWANRVMAFATGADDAMMNLPSNVAAGLRALTHGQSFDEAYQQIKQTGEQATKNHGLAYGAGLGGGIAASLPFMPEAAATVAGRAAQGAKIGAGMAGVSEFADTKDPVAAAKAAAIGGAVGGAFSPAAEGVGALVSKVGGDVSGAAKAAYGAATGNLDDEAARRIALTIQQGQKVGDAGFTADEALQHINAGQPVRLMDMGGEGTRALARSAANTSPEGRFALNEAIGSRYDGQAERLAQRADEMSSGVSNFEKRAALEKLAKEQNAENYNRFREMSSGGVWTPELERVTASKAVQAGIKDAIETSREAAIARGQKIPEIPFVAGPDGTYQLATRADGTVIKPTGEFWDHVQRSMRTAADKAATYNEGSNKFGAGLINDNRKVITGELDRLSTVDGESVYKTARTGAAKFFGANDAIDAGEKFFTHKGTAQELAHGVSQFKGAEKNLFHDSVAQAVSKKLRVDVADRQNAINALFKNEEGRKKLLIGLGSKERMDQLEAQLHIERVMDAARPAVQGNSTTARQLSEIAMGGGTGMLGTGTYSGNEGLSIGGIAMIAGGLAKGKIDARLSQRIAEMLASNDAETIKKVAAMATKNPTVMNAFRKLETPASAGVGRVVGDFLGGR